MKEAIIYWIVNRDNGRAYIGSTIDLKGRWKVHRRSLRMGKHHSHKFQRDYDGGAQFDWIVVEDLGPDTDRECLLIVEQMYLDHHLPFYNVNPDAFCCMGMDQSKEWIVCGPDGVEKRVYNLKAYCREHGLERTNLGKVARGEIGQHKGHRCRRPEDGEFRFVPKPSDACTTAMAKANVCEWLITHPSGEQERVVGLRAFCQRHGLKPNSLVNAVRYDRPYKGYAVVRLGSKRAYTTRPSHKPSDAIPIP